MVILIIFWLKLCFASECELWTSGVIFDVNYPKLKSNGMFGDILEPILGGIYEEEGDNFVQLTLPVNRIFKRILFVTPRIANVNPEGVKETFFRLYCNLIGILLRRRDFIKFTRGTFFALKPNESKFALTSCLNEFERNFGIKLFTAMIDSGPYDLTIYLKQEFTNRGIALFRHPAKILNGQIYYSMSRMNLCEFELKFEKYSWKRNQFLRRRQIFKIHEKLRKNQVQERKIESKSDTKEIDEALEKLHGPLEEISLDEPVQNDDNFYLTKLFTEEKKEIYNDDKEYYDEEYEIIKSEDLKYYWQSR
jgi:hypothetical protein